MDLQSPTLFFLFSGQGKFYSYMGYDSSKYVDEIMRFSRVVRASDCQCRSRNCPGFDPSILSKQWNLRGGK
jgi:hypothetical protein